MIRDLSKDLIKAVAQINQKSREAFVAEQKTLQEKMQAKAMKMPGQPAPKADPAAHAGAADMAKKNMKEAAEGTTPKTEKEKKLAAMRPPADKITHGDVLHGRGVRKEAWEDMMKAVQKRREEQGTGKFDKKETGTGTMYTRKASTFDDGGKDADMKKADKKMKKEEAGSVDEQIKGTGTALNALAGVAGAVAGASQGGKYKKHQDAQKLLAGQGGGQHTDMRNENKDTPGNSTHQCAIHVKSEQFGEGKTLFSQHAEPDASGNIAWYDVMFDEGIKRVKTEDLEILVSEGHMNHKKKKM
jgi:hypothetical protein